MQERHPGELFRNNKCHIGRVELELIKKLRCLWFLNLEPYWNRNCFFRCLDLHAQSQLTHQLWAKRVQSRSQRQLHQRSGCGTIKKYTLRLSNTTHLYTVLFLCLKSRTNLQALKQLIACHPRLNGLKLL